MLSANAIKNELACRFCWMCRHLCPVGLRTGRESNTPRAKGLLLDMVERGEPYSASMAAEMYECCLCGACAASCETGFDPRVFIREARSQALVDGLAPEAVRHLLESISQYGNIFGVETPPNPAAAYAVPKASVLLYAGPTALVKTPWMAESAARLLVKAGIPFMAWKNEPACGSEMADLIGYVAEVVDSARPLIEAVKESGAKTVVALDPHQAQIMRQEYPALGVELHARVETATSYFSQLVNQGKLSPAKIGLRNATYHDTGRLARDLDETESPRALLTAMGVDIREMFLNRANTRDCGDEVLAGHSPAIAALTATGRWDDVVRCGATAVIAPCPVSYDILNSHRPEGMEVRSLLCLLAQACGA